MSIKPLYFLAMAGTGMAVAISTWFWVQSPPEGIFAEYLQKPKQTLPQMEEELARQILNEVTACVQQQVRQLGNWQELENAGAVCFFETVMLQPDGKVRDNTEVRLNRLLQLLQVQIPQPVVKGQAEVKLAPIPSAQVFSLPVQVQGKPQTFLLDTGASSSIISFQIADALRITGTTIPSKLLSYSVIGDQCDGVEAKFLNLPELRVGAAVVTGLSGMGINQVPAGVAGILGMDFLSNYNLYLHPQRSLLRLLPRTPVPNDPQLLPLVGKLGVMTVKAQVNGKAPAFYLLDTGADLMVIGEGDAKQLGIDLKDAPEIEVQGFCGTEKASKVRLHSVQVGEHQLTNLDAVVIKGDILKLLGVQGIIGQNYLNHFEQYWYFGDRNPLGYPENGYLRLTPILPIQK